MTILPWKGALRFSGGVVKQIQRIINVQIGHREVTEEASKAEP